MKLEVLMSCMHQTDDILVRKSCLTGNVVMVNQCQEELYQEFRTERGMLRMFSCTERGLTKSRNRAIKESNADICLLCDDDEIFLPDYEPDILQAYRNLPEADIIIFKMTNYPEKFKNKVMRLRFPQTMHVASWQISFRRQRLLESGVRFDELLGAGTGNGAEEELKFLLDSQKAGLKIYYVPTAIASVGQQTSTWFEGFTEQFFENRGATTRYILGRGPAYAYALYYVIRKRNMYCSAISPRKAFLAISRGIRENKIAKQADARRRIP